MKKLIIISFMAFAIQSQAQNVGINTPSPNYQFTVQKDGIGIAHTSSTGSVEIVSKTNTSPSSGWFGTYNKVPMHFGSYSNSDISIMTNGNVGIGITAPISDALLEVNGTTKINGEVNRPSTGSANMVPIAYSSVFSDGTVQANSGNISCVRIAAGKYEITITGENYYYLDYITTAVAHGPSNSPRLIDTGSVSNKLTVSIFNLAGVLTDTPFSFVTFKP